MTERNTGVGPGRDDTLVIAFGAFLVTSFMASELYTAFASQSLPLRSSAVILLPNAFGLVVIAWRQRNNRLFAVSGLLVAGTTSAMFFRETSFGIGYKLVFVDTAVLEVLFAATTIIGIVWYPHERALSECE